MICDFCPGAATQKATWRTNGGRVVQFACDRDQDHWPEDARIAPVSSPAR